MVFQDYTSFDHRTVLDNVTFGLECQGVPRTQRDELGREWIEHVGLERGRPTQTSIRTSFPAACGSAWPSPGR